LRRRGPAAVGRCPLHADHGRPNFYVWTESQSWFCFRCNLGGDVVSLVERIEGLSFREAIERLETGSSVVRFAPGLATPEAPRAPTQRLTNCSERPPEELLALRAAVWIYHQRLIGEPIALTYLEQRGFERAVIEESMLGYAAGDELLSYIRWRKLELEPCLR